MNLLEQYQQFEFSKFNKYNRGDIFFITNCDKDDLINYNDNEYVVGPPEFRGTKCTFDQLFKYGLLGIYKINKKENFRRFRRFDSINEII